LIGKLQVFHKEWRFISKFPLPLANRLQNPPANGEQGPGGLKKKPKPAAQKEARKKLLSTRRSHYLANLVSYLPEEICLFRWNKNRALHFYSTSHWHLFFFLSPLLILSAQS
jgi:hypothetical protein